MDISMKPVVAALNGFLIINTKMKKNTLKTSHGCSRRQKKDVEMSNRALSRVRDLHGWRIQSGANNGRPLPGRLGAGRASNILSALLISDLLFVFLDSQTMAAWVKLSIGEKQKIMEPHRLEHLSVREVAASAGRRSRDSVKTLRLSAGPRVTGSYPGHGPRLA